MTQITDKQRESLEIYIRKIIRDMQEIKLILDLSMDCETPNAKEIEQQVYIALKAYIYLREKTPLI
jgi:hypothetical protein